MGFFLQHISDRQAMKLTKFARGGNLDEVDLSGARNIVI
jgi:hypothetical protein